MPLSKQEYCIVRQDIGKKDTMLYKRQMHSQLNIMLFLVNRNVASLCYEYDLLN